MKRSIEIEMGIHATIASLMTESEKETLEASVTIGDVCRKGGISCEDCFFYSLDCQAMDQQEGFLDTKAGILSALESRV